MTTNLRVFGEVLFDHFPDGSRVLGGAPFNVAWHLAAFGLQPHFISRVGDDSEGSEVLAAMRSWGMSTAGVQVDPVLPTGLVSVQLVDDEPVYDIVAPAAYDAITATPSPSPSPAAGGLIYHGTLAMRDERARHAAHALRCAPPDTVFVDVNLRDPWWERSRVLELLAGAHWVKLNADELALLHPGGGTREQHAADFIEMHDLHGLVLTAGGEGATVMTREPAWSTTARPANSVDVVDTVGAGDALASVMIAGIVRGWPLGQTLHRAQAFASAIVGRRGATVNDPAFYRDFVSAWGLAD